MALKLIVLLFIGAFVGMFFVKGPDGMPILTIKDLMPEVSQSLDKLGDKAGPSNANVQPSGPTKVYKWKDENGIWQFSNREEDSVDTAGNGVEVMELDGDINIIPAVEIPPATTRNTQRARPKQSNLSALPSGLTTVSPEKIGEMMDTVNNLQNTVDQRKADLDKITGGNN